MRAVAIRDGPNVRRAVHGLGGGYGDVDTSPCHFVEMGASKPKAMINLGTENLIPVLDVLKIIPVSKPTLRRWTASGKLETVRAGAKVFTSTEAVQRLLQPGPEPIVPRAVSPRERARARPAKLQEAQSRLAERFSHYTPD